MDGTGAQQQGDRDGPFGGAGNGAPVDFLISRAGADKAFAQEIAQILHEADHSVLLQDLDFGNKNFVDQMNQGLERAKRVIVLLSPDYLASEYCTAEWTNALAGDPLNRTERLIILRVGECAPAGLMRAIAYWDLVEVRHRRNVVRDIVVTAIKTGRRGPPPGIMEDYWREPRAICHPGIRPTSNFTGRADELTAIEAALWSGDTVALTQAATVHGLGGVGKSVLAREYGASNRERYAGVWWLDAGAPVATRGNATQTDASLDATMDPGASGIMDGLIALGSQFIPGLDEVQNREEAARVTYQFLSQAGFEKPWLIIFDNIESEKTLRDWMPDASSWSGGGVQVLATSRIAGWSAAVRPLPLGIWPRERSVEFLRKESGRKGLLDAELEAIADALGDLPLALAHAAAYLRANRSVSGARYLGRLKKHLSEAPADADYPRAVFATFMEAMEGIEAPGADVVLGIAAFLAPEDIPADLFSQVPDMAAFLDEALGQLDRYSLIRLDEAGQMFSIHRLVQLAIRSRLEAGGHAEGAAVAALELVADAFPFESGDVRTWPQCERLRKHAEAVLEVAPDEGDVAAKTSHLLNQLALYVKGRAEFGASEPLYRRALAIDEASFGPDHPEVATSLNNLGALLQATNRLAEAEPLMRRAVAIWEASLGPDHPEVATSLNNLGALLQATNRPDEAEPLMRRALAIDEASFGPNHPGVARDLNNLGALLQVTNRPDEAEPLMRRALGIWEASLGTEHPDVAKNLNNLALLLQATNRPDEAEPLMRRVVEIFEKSLGPDHPNVATSLNNLGHLLQATNRPDEAEPLMRRVVEIFEKSLGPDHPNVATSLNNLGALLQATNRPDEAEPLMRRAVAIWEASLGPDHPSTVTGKANFAALLAAIEAETDEELIADVTVTVADFPAQLEEDPTVVEAAAEGEPPVVTEAASDPEPAMSDPFEFAVSEIAIAQGAELAGDVEFDTAAQEPALPEAVADENDVAVELSELENLVSADADPVEPAEVVEIELEIEAEAAGLPEPATILEAEPIPEPEPEIETVTEVDRLPDAEIIAEVATAVAAVEEPAAETVTEAAHEPEAPAVTEAPAKRQSRFRPPDDLVSDFQSTTGKGASFASRLEQLSEEPTPAAEIASEPAPEPIAEPRSNEPIRGLPKRKTSTTAFVDGDQISFGETRYGEPAAEQPAFAEAAGEPVQDEILNPADDFPEAGLQDEIVTEIPEPEVAAEVSDAALPAVEMPAVELSSLVDVPTITADLPEGEPENSLPELSAKLADFADPDLTSPDPETAGSEPEPDFSPELEAAASQFENGLTLRDAGNLEGAFANIHAASRVFEAHLDDGHPWREEANLALVRLMGQMSTARQAARAAAPAPSPRALASATPPASQTRVPAGKPATFTPSHISAKAGIAAAPAPSPARPAASASAPVQPAASQLRRASTVDADSLTPQPLRTNLPAVIPPKPTPLWRRFIGRLFGRSKKSRR